MIRNDRGMTLIELLMATSIMGVVIAAIYSIFTFGMQSYNISNNRATAQQEARMAVDLMSRHVRMAETLIYSYTQSDRLRMQADYDDEKKWETVEFYRQGTDIYMKFTDDTGAITTKRLANNVRNTDIFTYYTPSGDLISDENARPSNTKRITIKLVIDDNPSAPPDALSMATDVDLRNQK